MGKALLLQKKNSVKQKNTRTHIFHTMGFGDMSSYACSNSFLHVTLLNYTLKLHFKFFIKNFSIDCTKMN